MHVDVSLKKCTQTFVNAEKEKKNLMVKLNKHSFNCSPKKNEPDFSCLTICFESRKKKDPMSKNNLDIRSFILKT